MEYDNESFGVIVDRFRWEGGCIVEHVSILIDEGRDNANVEVVGPGRDIPDGEPHTKGMRIGGELNQIVRSRQDAAQEEIVMT